MEKLLGFDRAPTLKIGKHNDRINMTLIEKSITVVKVFAYRILKSSYSKKGNRPAQSNSKF
jgi:hypothetical protein